MSINLAQCQLPREAHTEKAVVTWCQGPAWNHKRSPGLHRLEKGKAEAFRPFFWVLADRLTLTAAEAKPALAQMC